MLKFYKVSALVLASFVVACGGGGGSPGENPNGAYSITLRADRVQLPVNIDPANNSAGIGAYAPYTTTLHVEARKDGLPIPGGEKIFGCNVSGGLTNGALYYLDGKDEHMVEVDDGLGGKIKVPGAYRSIDLGSNSGGNSFHFHAGDQAGTSTITCSVTEPSSNRQVSASVQITVGGSTGKVASIRTIAQAPGYLGVQGNLKNIPSSVAIQATVRDDINNLIQNPSGRNVQVAIRQNQGGAAVGARLVSGAASGGAIQVGTNNGVATFNLISGSQSGPIVLEITADRSDNNVDNGIQDPMVALYQVHAVKEVAAAPLTIATTTLGPVANGVPYTYALLAAGGVPPFSWTVTGLPDGLTVNDSGVISGTPLAPAGTYNLRLRVIDANGDEKVASVPLELTGQPLSQDDFTINFCTSGDGSTVAQPCKLPDAVPGTNYTYAFSASVPGVTWTFSGLPSWLAGTTAGQSGVISGMPKATVVVGTDVTCGDSGKQATFLVTAVSGALSVARYVSIKVDGTLHASCP